MSIFNYTFLSSTLNCSTAQYFSVFSDFFECYKELVSQNVLGAVGQIFLGVMTLIACVLVLILLLIKPHKTIFDTILLCHSK